MKKYILITLALSLNIACFAQKYSSTSVTKNNMKVSWYFHNNRIFFEMNAPTDGWLTIGFNDTTGTKGAYLLMGRVKQGVPNITEHFTINPGNYKTIESLGKTVQVKDVSGIENSNYTSIKFSLPQKAASKYQRDLFKGNEYVLIIAFSREDDYQHHSIMRTSVRVKL